MASRAKLIVELALKTVDEPPSASGDNNGEY